MAQQDDYYYEIQLTNKQLVFYFMAGATVLILSFLAGVMVGRGVDAEHGRAGRAHARPGRGAAWSPRSRRAPAPPPAEDLTYAQRLESDKADEGLEKPSAPRPRRRRSRCRPRRPRRSRAAGRERRARDARGVAPTLAAAGDAAPTPVAAPSPTPGAPSRGAAAAPPAAGSSRSRSARSRTAASADAVIGPAEGQGLRGVRAGAGERRTASSTCAWARYARPPDAERVQTRLRDEEKFKPFIVKN